MKRNIKTYLYKNGIPNPHQQHLSREDQIRIILEETNFDKINRVMTFLDWTWFSYNGVPTIEQLKTEAKRLLEDVYNDSDDYEYPCITHETGGFVATRDMIDGIKMLSLDFVLTGWDFEYDDVTNAHYEG